METAGEKLYDIGVMAGDSAGARDWFATRSSWRYARPQQDVTDGSADRHCGKGRRSLDDVQRQLRLAEPLVQRVPVARDMDRRHPTGLTSWSALAACRLQSNPHPHRGFDAQWRRRVGQGAKRARLQAIRGPAAP